MNILILGASGQLGQSLQKQAQQRRDITVLALSRADFSVMDSYGKLVDRIGVFHPDIIINCAAYTQVDKAESDEELAFEINGTSLTSLSEIANKLEAKLIHISTDFVFDGSKSKPYLESDETNPLSVYGRSKLDGERRVQALAEDYAIFRTSWLYSKDKPCFYTTMLRLAESRDELSVVSDQLGTPTFVDDLSDAIFDYLEKFKEKRKDLFHFSNEGQVSWCDFAKEIFLQNNVKIKVNPIPTSGYPTPAKRPAYSVMSKSKISELLGREIPTWKDSLMKVAKS